MLVPARTALHLPGFDSMFRNATLSFLLTGIAVALVFPPGAARASTIEGLSVEEQAHASDAVIRGAVLSTSPIQQPGGHIMTRVEIAVDDVLKGTEQSVYVLLVPGGRLGDFATRVSGADRYEPGEEVLVFLESLGDDLWTSRALAFTKFSIDIASGTPVARRELAGLRIQPPRLAAPIAEELLRSEFPLDELVSTVERALEGGAR